jgi:FkbM family methyltransferase
MRLVNSLRRRWNNFLLAALTQNVKDKKIRPFCIDEEGLWFETQYGFFVYCNLRDRILELQVNPAWEQLESSFIVNNLKEGDIFVDVGAHIGYFSMLAARQRAKKVLAIEPVPKTYDMLVMNIRHNNLSDVIEPFNVALGSKDHTAKSVSSLGPKNHIEYQAGNVHANLPTVEVEVTTLDNLLKNEQEIDKIDFVKVDIEGYEYEFLLGAQQSIIALKPMILMEIEEHRLAKYGVTAEDMFNVMADLGYEYLSVGQDLVAKGSLPKEDLTKARNFVFYTCDHSPIY